MLDVSVEINGRRVNPRNMKDTMEGLIVSGIVDSLKNSIRGIRCPDHNELPKLKVKGGDLDNLSVEVSGCCDVLTEKVQKKLQ